MNKKTQVAGGSTNQYRFGEFLGDGIKTLAGFGPQGSRVSRGVQMATALTLGKIRGNPEQIQLAQREIIKLIRELPSLIGKSPEVYLDWWLKYAQNKIAGTNAPDNEILKTFNEGRGYFPGGHLLINDKYTSTARLNAEWIFGQALQNIHLPNLDFATKEINAWKERFSGDTSFELDD